MSAVPIWRYLSLAKYVDLLRTKSLYFPKAALFSDGTEGKWFAHSMLHAQRTRWVELQEPARILEQLLERAGDSPQAIWSEASSLLMSKGDDLPKIVHSVLTDVVGRVFAHKRREYLESMISSWRGHYQKHNQDVSAWVAENNIYRECTYISCWNRSPSTSLAMWEMYGGGREAVVVRSTEDKLAYVLTSNSDTLERHGLEGQLAHVQYIANLKNPDEAVHSQIYEITVGSSSTHVSQFTVKPIIYKFEQEVRAILYPKRENIFEPIRDPHPQVSGFSLPVGRAEDEPEPSVTRFVDAVYIHPTLDSSSMMFEVLKEVNKRLGDGSVKIIADRVEALGADIYLQ